MAALLRRSGEQLPPPEQAFQGIVGREPYPVGSKAKEIIARLIRSGVTNFKALFQNSKSRSEIVATFLAILELCKSSRIRLAGTGSDCTVVKTDAEPEEETAVPAEAPS